jgi:hypothetical protein
MTKKFKFSSQDFIKTENGIPIELKSLINLILKEDRLRRKSNILKIFNV